MQRHILSDIDFCNLELILDGSFAPLNGFMNEDDYNRCLDECRLASGDVWPLPITLQMQQAPEIGDSIPLYQRDGPAVGELLVESVYQPDMERECLRVFQSTDRTHPTIATLMASQDCYYVGGKVTALNEGPRSTHYDFAEFRLTPAQWKARVAKQCWNTIVAFHTRNPMHNSHLQLVKDALAQFPEDGTVAFIHPTIGPTQASDIDCWTRVKCYEELLTSSFPRWMYEFAVIQLAMRMAGPREALMHALIRRNYGCTHFIMGRDPAGPSVKKSDGTPFFQPYDAHALVDSFSPEELGITVIKAKEVAYYPGEGFGPVKPGQSGLHLSGTELRRRIRADEQVPDWFTDAGVTQTLRESMGGRCFYLIGLSGSGKTTLARALTSRLREEQPANQVVLLDGDEIRRNISLGLGFSREDRSTNVRRIGYVASLIARTGATVVCANIAPYEADREWNRMTITNSNARYVEVYLSTPLEVCEERDVKGLYEAARSGKIAKFTGISDVFEEPQNATITLDTSKLTVRECIDKLLQVDWID